MNLIESAKEEKEENNKNACQLLSFITGAFLVMKHRHIDGSSGIHYLKPVLMMA
jgi:hypothetical protein